MPKQIPIPTDFRCNNPKQWIKIEISKLERKLASNLGFISYTKTLEIERKIKTLESYGY